MTGRKIGIAVAVFAAVLFVGNMAFAQDTGSGGAGGNGSSTIGDTGQGAGSGNTGDQGVKPPPAPVGTDPGNTGDQNKKDDGGTGNGQTGGQPPALEDDPEVKAKLSEFAKLRAEAKDLPEVVYQKLRKSLIDSTDAAIRAIEAEKTAVQQEADAIKTANDAELQKALDEMRDAARRARERLEVLKRSVVVTQAGGGAGPVAGGYRGFPDTGGNR